MNSTVAASLSAVKLGITIAHLEAGLRSFDRKMPEEINRIITDAIADILWTPSVDGDHNLEREGISKSKICRVGNIMIDSLEMLRHSIEKQETYDKYFLKKGQYGVVTIHRPSNVDDEPTLKEICLKLLRISGDIPLLFPVHPRTRKNIEKIGMWGDLNSSNNLIIETPLNYLSFMNLIFNCRFVLTDSGGIQEESTYLGIPCLTMRENTERPITVERGTNQLCHLRDVEEKVRGVLTGSVKKTNSIDLWDGHTAERVVGSIKKIFNIF